MRLPIKLHVDPRTVIIFLAVVAFTGFQPGLGVAQTVRGQIVDHASGVPVPDASIVLLNKDGQVKRIAIADSAGSYSIRTPSPGTYSFRVDAQGYNTLNALPFVIKKGQSLQFKLQLWTFTELPAVVVTADSAPFAPGPLRDFYDRVERGMGHFVTRKDIEERAVTQMTSLLRLVAGVRIVKSPQAGAGWTVRIKGSPCPPSLWVDNAKWGSVDTFEGLDRELFPHDLEGIEIYRPSEVPIEFSGIDAGCGAIVVWTRRGP